MALDILTAVANAISAVASDAKPYIDDHLAQKYEQENVQRIEEWQSILNMSDTDSRADLIELFAIKLCNAAGQAIGTMGDNISVPLEALTALVKIASEEIKVQQTLNFALHKA